MAVSPINIYIWNIPFIKAVSLMSKQLRSSMVVVNIRLLTSLVLLYLFCNIHVTGVSTEPGGAYSSGAPVPILHMLEVHAVYSMLPYWAYNTDIHRLTEYHFGTVVTLIR